MSDQNQVPVQTAAKSETTTATKKKRKQRTDKGQKRGKRKPKTVVEV